MSSKKKKSKKNNKVDYLPIDKNPEFNSDLQQPIIVNKEELLDLIIDNDEWPELDLQENDENVDDKN